MLRRVLIANRGEVAVRVARAAAELGMETVAVTATDDLTSAHGRLADRTMSLGVAGPRAYLDSDNLVRIARETGCDAVHPGYGFLSESAAFATACLDAGLVFVGPSPVTLATLGDKSAARGLAARLDVPLLPGTEGAVDVAGATSFLRALGPNGRMLLKAVAGGGGRGIHPVDRIEDVGAAHARCAAEAAGAFGSADVYAEAMMPAARHIEVQIIGDGHGGIVALGERECSLQRRRQKLVELAPSPSLHARTREIVVAAAIRMARAVDYRGLGTFEFLVAAGPARADAAVAFIEANPRLQVEHTVTEEAFGVDLVQAQLRIAGGAKLAELDLERPRAPTRAVVQLRINAEAMRPDGSAVASAGSLQAWSTPGGPGVRVDSHAAAGFVANPAYDSLLAKLIVAAPLGDHARLLAKAARALGEVAAVGVPTNSAFLQALLDDAAVRANAVSTTTIDERAAEFVAAASRYARVETQANAALARRSAGSHAIAAPLPGRVVAIAVEAGARVQGGATLAVLESMKMEHLIEAPHAGVVAALHLAVGDVVAEGEPVLDLTPAAVDADATVAEVATDLDVIRPDLQHVLDTYAFTHDARRADAVSRRHQLGFRTARENLADLVDPGSFIEYGAAAVAAQRRRRSFEDLQKNTPADGLITGIGTVNAAHTTPEAARVAVMIYDYTVLAGTQGKLNHKKSDRILDLAEQWRLPFVLYAEGGGGRPGDTDAVGVAGLDGPTFYRYARLSGHVPVIGVVAGRCFAGNAALLGCSDVIIATKNTSIGMGGPAMIEGGGLGVVEPDAVGPASVQVPNGVIDVLVEDEAAATAVAKQYLGYIQGARPPGPAPDQRRLRHVIPENRLRVYDIREVIRALADDGSFLELRPEFGLGAVTGFLRIEGKPFALIANNPKHLGGALDGPACDKLARFLQLTDSYGLPVLSLCDTPGFMVGPESETTAMVRRTSRLFLAGASMRVPTFCVVLRKGYGLGAMAMAAGSFRIPMFTIAWPSAEFGGMGLEGYVRLGFRKELEAVPAGPERTALYDRLVAEQYAKGRATNMASFLEIDAVIDPAETRTWLLRGLASAPSVLPARKQFVDAF
jgi:acetyl/propionyl-CoA carboxylase alpha subunit/acetyl-CoA carboxylase carboxyltransferase component